jgi:hypothetical protein
MARKAFVAGLRLAFGHAIEHVAPDLFRRQLAGLHTCDGLDVSRETFFHPVLIVGHRGEGRVDELMGDGPIGSELLLRRVLAETDASEAGPAADIAPRGSLHNSTAVGDRNDEDADARDGKDAVVSGNSMGRHLDALHDHVVG